MLAVNEKQVLNEKGFPTPVVFVLIVDTKAQVALSGCRNFTCNDPLAHVCWLCGGNRIHCLGAFGQGNSILLKVWQWGGMTLPAVLPFQRPPDFGLHGVHRLVHCAGSGLVKAFLHHHGWTKGRALVWVQWFWDDIRVESRTATAADCEQEKVVEEGPAIVANCPGGMGETARVGLHCRLLGGGQSFTSPGASVMGSGYNDMDCLLAFVGREISSDQ